jgi:NAD(P)-dependent dehydrogenase (short-subunit alcohol dehydrogenase family)
VTSGRVVVITGASSGIGRETALAFASTGAALVLTARGEEALEVTADAASSRGGDVITVPADVAEWTQVSRVADAAVQAFGRIDVWVNNAAVSAYGELADIPVEVVHRVMDVTLHGQVHGVKAALPIMRRQGHGTIIGVSSALGARAVPLQVPYCMAKAATNALYEGLRLEERRARSGVRVAVVLPASIGTPFYDGAASFTGRRPSAVPPVYHPVAVADAIVRAADKPRRHVYVGGSGLQLALLERLSPSLADRLLYFGRIDKLQQRGEPDDGRSNLYEPMPGPGASIGRTTRRLLKG